MDTPPPAPKANHDERIDYGRRVVWYAFGTAGDIDIANVQPTEKQINNFVYEKKQNREKLQQHLRLRIK